MGRIKSDKIITVSETALYWFLINCDSPTTTVDKDVRIKNRFEGINVLW